MGVLLKKHFQVQIENFTNMRQIPGMRIPEEVKQTYRIVSIDKKDLPIMALKWIKLHLSRKLLNIIRNKKKK